MVSSVICTLSLHDALPISLLLLSLGFLAGMNGANILITIVADIIMVLAGLFSAFSHRGGQKWGMLPCASVYLLDRKSTRLNSSHLGISYAVFCLKKTTT